MSATRTPGRLYAVQQAFPSLKWRVVPIDVRQGERMRERGEKNVYDTSAQAYAVTQRLNGGSDRAAPGLAG